MAYYLLAVPVNVVFDFPYSLGRAAGYFAAYGSEFAEPGNDVFELLAAIKAPGGINRTRPFRSHSG